MKLSIEINDQMKKLLLELLQDGDIQNKILDIAGQVEDLDDAVDARTDGFVRVDDIDDHINEFLKEATFSANYEG
tara:strand:- start:3453 stop:3677 length:225 start_codon:yes stop_codon:yes gene_type:complete